MPYLQASLVICVFGVISNTCMTILLTRPRLGTTINRLLALVTLSDALLMCSYFIYVLHFELGTLKDKEKCPVESLTFQWVLFQLLHSNWSVYLRAFSLWLSVIMAGYRKNVLSITVPRRQEPVGLSVKLASAVAVCVLIACVPIFLQNKIVEGPRAPVNDSVCPRNHSTYYWLRPTDFAEWNDYFLLKTAYWTNGLLLKLCPCTLLTYYLLRVVLLMYNRHRRRKKSLFRSSSSPSSSPAKTKKFSVDSNANSNRASTMMPTSMILVTILLTTVLCELPNTILSVMSGLFPHVFIRSTYVKLGEMMDLLSLFSCTSTSILYFVMSRSLRQSFVAHFCFCDHPWIADYLQKETPTKRVPTKVTEDEIALRSSLVPNEI